MHSRYCLNCGHEAHDGPLYKEVMDGDNKPIKIEITFETCLITI